MGLLYGVVGQDYRCCLLITEILHQIISTIVALNILLTEIREDGIAHIGSLYFLINRRARGNKLIKLGYELLFHRCKCCVCAIFVGNRVELLDDFLVAGDAGYNHLLIDLWVNQLHCLNPRSNFDCQRNHFID